MLDTQEHFRIHPSGKDWGTQPSVYLNEAVPESADTEAVTTATNANSKLEKATTLTL